MTIRTVTGLQVEAFPWNPESHPSTCPVCSEEGTPVGTLVLRAALKRELQGAYARDGFRFCATPSCPLAYFDNERATFIHKEELRVRVGRKDAGPEALVCYCLRVTEGRVLDEVLTKGCCRTLDDVAEATGALLGNACHIVNPSGRCCGTEVKAAVLKGLRLAGFGGETVEIRQLLEENVDHCRNRFGLKPAATVA